MNKHLERVSVVEAHPNSEGNYRFTLTNPLRRIGVDKDNHADHSLVIRAGQGDDDEVALLLSTAAGGRGGRTNPNLRSIMNPVGSVYQITLPRSVVEDMGADTSEDATPIFNVWAGDKMLLLELADEEETHYVTFDRKVDAIERELSEQVARDFRAVFQEGKDPEEWAEERGLTQIEESEHGTYNPKYYVERNVEKAKKVLDDTDFTPDEEASPKGGDVDSED